MGDEHAIMLDLFVELAQSLAVSRHGETGHCPDHLAQKEDHRADIEELRAQPLTPHVHDLQTGHPDHQRPRPRPGPDHRALI